jgi:cobalt/nickel transport system ATP-binding protein
MLELTNLLDRPPYQLSAGEKRRAALASALTMNPDVVLLDEPTAGLDPRSRGRVVELIGRLHNAGKTIVTCTHDLDIVPELAERVIVLNEQHSVEAEGTPIEILRNGALMTSVNLIHEHMHRHGDFWHSHSHHHGGDHDHTHE